MSTQVSTEVGEESSRGVSALGSGRVSGRGEWMPSRWWTALLTVVTLQGTACQQTESGKIAFDAGVKRPDALPVMLNKDLPFRYPPALYADKVQGNVTLRLYIDEEGQVVDDSTNVVESSNTPMLDSAAVRGARELKFVPAKLRGTPMAVAILFPVYFRHPEVKPPPGDTVLTPIDPSSATKASAPTGAPHTIVDTSKKS